MKEQINTMLVTLTQNLVILVSLDILIQRLKSNTHCLKEQVLLINRMDFRGFLRCGVVCGRSVPVKSLLLRSPYSLYSAVHGIVNPLADSVHYFIKYPWGVRMNVVPCSTHKVYIHIGVRSSRKELFPRRAVHPGTSAIYKGHWNVCTQLGYSLKHGPLGKSQRKLHVRKGILTTAG